MKKSSSRGKAPEDPPASESWYRILFEDNPRPSWICDRDALGFLAVNAAALHRYGYSRAEFGKMTLRDLLPQEDVPALLESLREPESAAQAPREWRHVTKAGEKIWMEIRARFIQFDGKPAKLVSATDVTQRKGAEEERGKLLAREQAALAEARAASRAKDEFLALISHELRTPMTAMLGWMWLLRSKTLDQDAAARALDIIERNMHQQAQSIEDILDVSNIVSGKLRLEPRVIPLGPIIEAAVHVVRPAAEAKRIRIETRIDAGAGPVHADHDRIRQIVWNLLSNAVKFTPEDGALWVGLRRAGDHAEISVRDNGQGISPDFAPYIFDRFRQAELSITRTQRGLGLGLSLVRDLVELHGGAIRAASDGVGRGATFVITLPLASPSEEGWAESGSEATAVAPPKPAAAPDLRGVRILLVEDEGDAREMIAAVLEKYGATVASAGTAAEAMDGIARFRPDVLVADIAMPGEDGYSLIRRVRALRPDQGGSVPAAALTGFVQQEDKQRALESGYQIHVPKPVDPLELAETLQRLARVKRP